MKYGLLGVAVLLVAIIGFALRTNTEAQVEQPKLELTDMPDAARLELQREAANLQNLGAAPELHEGIWLNSSLPLKLADLRGKVVLLDMWTFGCINCIHVIPSLRDWHEKYADSGLVIVANHYPEFTYEHDLNNLREAMMRLDVPYPVLQDNGGLTWRAYNNRYWPTMYLIDKQGNIRYRHIGEGRYDQTERAIQALLAEDYTLSDEAAVVGIAKSLTSGEVVNVRSGPGTDYAQIGTIQPDEAYYVVAEQPGWYQILYGGAQAYVSADYVMVNQ